MTGITVRAATPADLPAIAAIARATDSGQEFAGADPAYATFLLEHGRLVVSAAGGGGPVTGFGATVRFGPAERDVTMLTDLYVDPAVHGGGAGRAILDELWGASPRRMTFASAHAHALPLYTRFGLDAWWPLLYLDGSPAAGPAPAGWAVTACTPEEAGARELAWTGADRTAEHRAIAARPGGRSVLASRHGVPLAAASAGGADPEYGLAHLAVAPGTGRAGEGGRTGQGQPAGQDGRDEIARDAVLAIVASLTPRAGTARAYLPAPHPAVRPLLARGWRVVSQDTFMATDPALLDPRAGIPHPGLA
ncbi:MAG TPA: GNAT family N-acetyltransferase [Streptosporangiaceae bacterium]|jgi:GNAT superfamily N-acetyltransferase